MSGGHAFGMPVLLDLLFDLETTMNKALLGKWLWGLENTDGLWQKLLREKYLTKKTTYSTEVQTGRLPFQIKEYFLQFCERSLGDGCNTQFWKDKWTGNQFLPGRRKDAGQILRYKGSCK